MSASTLMADLARLGIRLEARGDRLRYRPRQALTLDLVQRMKVHKQEVLTILATSDLPETTRAAYQSFDRSPTADHRSKAVENDSTVPQCGRCGHTEYRDTPIHDGQSVRRDCANCGRTYGFPVWKGEATT